MRYEEQLRILEEKGIEEWNLWRLANSKVRVNLEGAKLAGANLSGVDLSNADLQGADLEGASLQKANLRGSNLHVVNLSRANLYDATLSGANLRRAHLVDACLREASLLRTDLGSANLNGADFTNSVFGITRVLDADLSHVKGLDEVKHFFPSTIGIDTLVRSRGIIPERFLREAGVPEPFIVNMKSLVASMSPIEFYSCFISYSSMDKCFAEQLHSDLTRNRVRCWFAPQDLRIGDRLRPSFAEAIQMHDKLVVVLSASAIESKRVEDEVETAFEKERRDRNRRPVLFPIRLDDRVMETDEAWAADIRRTRHIGDFRKWRDQDAYRTAFERLLHDLKL